MADPVQIRVRRDTLANWQAANPTLADGEPAWVTDTKDLITGDGESAFSELWSAATSVAGRAAASAVSAEASASAAADFFDAAALEKAERGGWGVVALFGTTGTGSSAGGRVTDGTVTQGNERNFVIPGKSAAAIRLLYQNIQSNQATTSASGEADGSNPITVRASLDDGTSLVPVFFNGKRDVVLDPGASAWSDPVNFDVTAGTAFWVRNFTQVAAGGVWFKNRLGQDAQACGGEYGTALTDKTLAGTIPATFSYLYGPTSIIGYSQTAPAGVGIVGDSIAAGVGDQGPAQASGNFLPSFITRGLRVPTPNIPFTRIAEGGECASVFVGAVTNRMRRLEALRYCKYVICELGSNDIYSQGAPLETLQGSLLALWKLLRARGHSTFQTTITPRSTSTDNFATTANQTPQANSSVRTAFNDWLRAGAPISAVTGAPVAAGASGAVTCAYYNSAGLVRAGTGGHPVTGVFEVADLAEPTRNAGVWKTGYMTGGDGTHPVVAGHDQLKAGIYTPAFV
jgi:lysophospholipase L1-like esterase